MTLTYILPTVANRNEIMPVPTCCKLHAHNYTCIPKNLGRRGTLDPTGQLVILTWLAFCNNTCLRLYNFKVSVA